ncbi:MAG: PorT family protein [Bacteroidales bacterium]|nr:PorT family protein [Bacteroidales bacterium]
MKKILLIVAIMVMAATATFAQFGGRIGLDLANFTGDWKDGYKTSAGLHLGLVYNFELADAISLQPGAFYVQRNYKDDFDNKIHSHYIEVPIVAKYNLEVADGITIDPHAGPYFAFGFAGKNKDTDQKVFKKRSKDGMGVSNFDMGIQVGAGATFSDVIYVGLDYEFGFRDNADYFNPLVDPNKKLHARNGMFMITCGVWLPE